MTDLDNQVGFWIYGRPYLWVQGSTIEECKRFYILSNNNISLFDENNKLIAVDRIYQSMQSGQIPPDETFSLIPIDDMTCSRHHIVRNYFLAFTLNVELTDDGTFPNFDKIQLNVGNITFPWTDTVDIRVEGKPIIIFSSDMSYQKINITNNGRVVKSVLSYPRAFGDPSTCFPNTPCELTYTSLILKSTRSYLNLQEVVKSFYHWDPNDVYLVHKQASSPHTDGYQYSSTCDGNTKQIIFEILTGQRPIYDCREINDDYVVITMNDEGAIDEQEDDDEDVEEDEQEEDLTGEQEDLEDEDEDINEQDDVEDVEEDEQEDVEDEEEIWSGEKFVSLFDEVFRNKNFIENFPQLVCYDENQGLRREMEDQMIISKSGNVYLYAVLDGHGGARAAEDMAENIPEALQQKLLEKFNTLDDIDESDMRYAIIEMFMEIDRARFISDYEDKSGCTFTGILIIKNNGFVINLGDSRTVIYRSNKNDVDVVFATKDHKPEDERKRVEKAGGFVRDRRVEYEHSSSSLALSRALGDNDFKRKKNSKEYSINPAISATPDVHKIELKKGDTIVVACDGLWDVFDNKEAYESYVQHKDDDACELMIDDALVKGSTDNISVIVLKI